MKKGINKDFIRINFVVKPLLNEFSNKINKKNAKKLTLESSYIYKENQKISDDFENIEKILEENFIKNA